MLDSPSANYFYSCLVGAPPLPDEKKTLPWRLMHVAEPPAGGTVDAAAGECTQNA